MCFPFTPLLIFLFRLWLLLYLQWTYITCLPYIDECCNTATSTTSQATCLSVGFRALQTPTPPLYHGSTVFQQLARCGVPRLSGPPDAMTLATGKPATTHQFAHDLLTLHRLYTPPQSAADHFKPPFFPGEFTLPLTQVRQSSTLIKQTENLLTYWWSSMMTNMSNMHA